MRIAEGGFWPLAYKNGYNGPAMLYLTALALKLAPAVATPRFVALLVSSLTVPVTYGAGRALGGRAAGTVAALLLALQGTPHEKASTPGEIDEILAARTDRTCVIVSDAHHKAMRLGARLAPVEGHAIGAGDDGDGYALYRWTP